MNEQFWQTVAARPDGVELLRAGEGLMREYNRACLPVNIPRVDIIPDRAASRALLLEALTQACESAIVVSPWLNRRWVNAELLGCMEALLQRGCSLHIGWGYLDDIRGIRSHNAPIHIQSNGEVSIVCNPQRRHMYSAYPQLCSLKQRYPRQMHLKLLGTHEKYVICDRQFAMLGSHNVLSSGDSLNSPRECSWKTTDITAIDAQIARFHTLPDLSVTHRRVCGTQLPRLV